MKKTFKTLEEQIKILESRGLIINDYDKTYDILFKENYFFINGYRHFLVKTDCPNQFKEGATFEELYSLFLFDRYLRNIMFKNILIVENNIKSIISYQLSKKYGYREHDYLNPKHFRQESFKLTQVNDILNKMKRQIRLNAKQHRATKHYISNYGYIPMWVSVKVLSFGIMAELYSILKEEDQDEVASYYNVSSYELNIYLALLSNYRNLCAHEDMLYDYQTQRSIPDCKYHELLNINKEYEEYVCGKNDFYAIIIIMKSMLSHDEFRNMMNEISYELERLSGLLHTTNINEVKEKIGFPTNYRDIIDL